jgi:hypothetical protein
MADATDSKSVARKGVWVQVPPPVLWTALFEEQPTAAEVVVRRLLADAVPLTDDP